MKWCENRFNMVLTFNRYMYTILIVTLFSDELQEKEKKERIENRPLKIYEN